MANYTGNFIQIDPEQATEYVISQLQKYDDATDNGHHPKFNPYTERIIMTLDDKRQVEVPEEIQRMAITQYVSQNSVREQHYETKTEAHEVDDSDDQSATSIFVQIVICLIIILTILYLLTLIRKGLVVM